MTPLALIIQIVMKPMIIIGLGALQNRASNTFSAATRHMNLLITLLLLPMAVLLGIVLDAPITIVLPAWDDTRQWLQTLSGSVVIGIYCFGVLWGSFYLLLGVIQLRSKVVDRQLAHYAELQTEIDRLCHLTGIERPVTLVLSEVEDTIASWGWQRSYVQLPMDAADWHSAERQLILLHELGHIARRDWLVLVIGKLVALLFWFLPPVWWLNSKLVDTAERACDDWVIQVSGRNADYAQLLLRLEKQMSDLPVSQLWSHSNFERIKALLERYADHDISLGAKQWGLSSLMAVLLLIPLTAVGFRSHTEDSNHYAKDLQLSEWLSSLSKQSGAAQPESSIYESLALAQQLREKPVYVDQPKILLKPAMEYLDVVAMSTEVETSALELSVVSLSEMAAKELTENVSESSMPQVKVKGYLPIRMVTPVYPSRAINRHIEGRVKVQFTIAIDGAPIHPQVVYAQPQGVFERAVLTALKQSRFQPMTINGTPTEVKGVSEEFHFRFSDSEDPPRPPVTAAITKIALTD